MGSPDQVPADEARERLQRGLKAIAVFDYNLALSELRPVPGSLESGTGEWAQGAFGLASALRFVQPVTEARVTESRQWFQAVAEHSPDPNLRGLALLELARDLELRNYPGEPTDLPQARKRYRAIADEFEGSAIGDEAVIRLANTYFVDVARPESYGEGVQQLLDYLQRHPDAEMAAVMWQQAAEAEFTLRGDPQAALEYYEQARQLGFAMPTKADNFLWKMSQLAELTGNLRQAAELYARILVETPRAHEGTAARRRLKQLAERHPQWELHIPKRGGSLAPESSASPTHTETARTEAAK